MTGAQATSPIALLRHFPTAWNGEQRLQGRTDIPLTDAARETLRALMLPPPWDTARIVASPLSRAFETAKILAQGRRVDTDERLVEQSWGDWEGQQAYKLLADPNSGFTPTHDWGPDTKAPNGESAREAWARTRPALAAIAETGQRTLIVTHKALMRRIMLNADPSDMPEIKRARLYPIDLGKTGLPRKIHPPTRLIARAP